MPSVDPFFRWTELDRTNYPEWRERIVESEAQPHQPRSYPGYPRWPLPRARARMWPALNRILLRRRCARKLGTTLPAPAVLGSLLQFSHGITADGGRGPVPSAGSLQALELYLVGLSLGWLPMGVYHYDRKAHALAQLAPETSPEPWQARVPSLALVEGGALLWILVGDADRVIGKYGERGLRFLLLEAGQLMQNLCLVSESLGMSTVPLGGFFERDVARAMGLLSDDLVLYVGLAGAT